MGNKFCKKRVDAVDAGAGKTSALDRIICKFTQTKQKWKSDGNLDQKQVNSYQVNQIKEVEKQPAAPANLSKSTDWTDVPLEVPDKVEVSYNNNTTKSNDTSTPIPPPRKKKSLRETLGSLIQYSKKPIEEELMTKKVIDFRCNCCENGLHRKSVPVKRTKTPSISSLPNYNDFKLSIAGETDVDKAEQGSVHSLPDENKRNATINGKIATKTSNDKTESYLTRARSFGSLLPTMLLHKMSTAKAPLAEIESDDSLGGLDDWGGLNMIEHYTPRDSSLPRPRRMRTESEMLADIEKQIIVDDVDDDDPVQDKKEFDLEKSEIAEVNVGHSNLLKILEQYGGESRVESPQKIDDFLNAERGHYSVIAT